MIRMYKKYDPKIEKYRKEHDMKTWQVISGNFETHQLFRKDPNLLRNIERRNKEEQEKELEEQKGYTYQWQAIPCRHCWACSMNYSAEWATRIMFEAKKYEDGKIQRNFFITLTYDDLHLPIAETLYYNGKKYENDGTWINGTLNFRDIDRFIKAMRKEFELQGHKGVRFYLCGEYGENTYRPHYHLILMNCPLDMSQFYDCHVDKKFFKAHWKSKQVERWWSEPRKKGQEEYKPLGMVDIAELEWGDAAYTARYTAKKIFKDYTKENYYEAGMIPETVRMSRRPGIGSEYYQEHKYEIYENDEIIARTVKNLTSTLKPPKAWDKKLKEEDPEFWENIRISREHAKERANKLKRELTDLTDKKMLENKEEELKRKAILLPRGL